MNSYKPGQSVYFSVQITQLGQFVDPTGIIVLTLKPPSGATLTPTVIKDDVGRYHAIQTIPMNAVPGFWVERWQTTLPDALVEVQILIDALDF